MLITEINYITQNDYVAIGLKLNVPKGAWVVQSVKGPTVGFSSVMNSWGGPQGPLCLLFIAESSCLSSSSTCPSTLTPPLRGTCDCACFLSKTNKS